MPALMGLIPQTVSPARLQEANALLALTRSIASVAGPALAGVLVVLGRLGRGDRRRRGDLRVQRAVPGADAPGGRPAGGRRRRRGHEPLPRRAARGLARGALARVAALGPDRDERLPRLRAARGLRARPGARRAASSTAPRAGPRSSPASGSAASWATSWRCASRCAGRSSSPPWRWWAPARRPRSSAAAWAPSGSRRSSCWPASASRSSSPSGT